MDEAPPTAPSVPREESPAPASSQLPLWPPEASSGSSPSPAVPESVARLEPPWSLKDLVIFVLFAAFAFFFANVAATAGLHLLQRGLGWKIALEEMVRQTPFIVAIQALWEGLWLILIYFTITLKYGRRFWEAIRWVRVKDGEIAYFLGGIALAALAQVSFQFFPSEKRLPIEELFTSAGASYLLAFFGICFAPFIEELVFRGYFYPVFERLWGLLTAVVLTALLFVTIHAPQLSGGWQEMSAIFVVGLALSYCRGKTGSLVPPYLMHLGYNTTLFVSLYFTTDRFQNLKG